VTDDLIFKDSVGGLGASSHVNIVPYWNDIDTDRNGDKTPYRVDLKMVGRHN